MNEIHPEALKQMKNNPENHNTTRWAAYQNQAMDSSSLGDMRFIAIGPKNTIHEPPKRYPDSHLGTGWAYTFIGWVDLDKGEVIKSD